MHLEESDCGVISEVRSHCL